MTFMISDQKNKPGLTVTTPEPAKGLSHSNHTNPSPCCPGNSNNKANFYKTNPATSQN